RCPKPCPDTRLSLQPEPNTRTAARKGGIRRAHYLHAVDIASDYISDDGRLDEITVSNAILQAAFLSEIGKPSQRPIPSDDRGIGLRRFRAAEEYFVSRRRMRRQRTPETY